MRQVLFVSQFTLYGFFKGNKPDFHNAMAPAAAKEFYDDFLKHAREVVYKEVELCADVSTA